MSKTDLRQDEADVFRSNEIGKQDLNLIPATNGGRI